LRPKFRKAARARRRREHPSPKKKKCARELGGRPVSPRITRGHGDKRALEKKRSELEDSGREEFRSKRRKARKGGSARRGGEDWKKKCPRKAQITPWLAVPKFPCGEGEI